MTSYILDCYIIRCRISFDVLWRWLEKQVLLILL